MHYLHRPPPRPTTAEKIWILTKELLQISETDKYYQNNPEYRVKVKEREKLLASSRGEDNSRDDAEVG
jgi:hypothetical protein